jgi:hypothetical protein
VNRKSRYACVLLISLFATVAALGAPMAGAIYTTDGSCSGVNLNLFNSKEDVYLDGGPQNPNASGLPDGDYWVKVTEPDGTPLGSSLSANATVASGEFVSCYRLVDLLVKASDASPGYDDTTNGGGEYKLWVSMTADFDNNVSKTDNFKVLASDDQGHLVIQKFYDANADGLQNNGETQITGWQVTVVDAPHAWVDSIGYTPADIVDEPGSFTVTESDAVQQNWNHTTPLTVIASIVANETTTVTFGNLCLGSGGGLTLGFWSNKNGARSYNNAIAVNQNLVRADGSSFDPTNHASFNKWILSASATNMAYMLSAQAAAMAQNVASYNVSASALLYAPGTGSASALGYATVGALLNEADALLAANSYTVGSGPDRTAQEAVKTALDRANNNLNFVQSQPCAFSF